MRKHFLLALQWAAVIPDNPELRLISPYPETPWRIQQLIHYDILRPRAITGSLAETVRSNPARALAPPVGKLTARLTSTSGLVDIEALAGRRKADCAIIGLSTAPREFSPVAVIPIGAHQLVDLRRCQGRGGELAGWAVFREEKRAAPLANEIPFEPSR